jgi:hypothetical protein
VIYEQRFLRYLAVSPSIRPGIRLRGQESRRLVHRSPADQRGLPGDLFNLLAKVLPAEEASRVTVRATREALSAMCQMAFDEGYQSNNPVRSIRIQHAPANPYLLPARPMATPRRGHVPLQDPQRREAACAGSCNVAARRRRATRRSCLPMLLDGIQGREQAIPDQPALGPPPDVPRKISLRSGGS